MSSLVMHVYVSHLFLMSHHAQRDTETFHTAVPSTLATPLIADTIYQVLLVT